MTHPFPLPGVGSDGSTATPLALLVPRWQRAQIYGGCKASQALGFVPSRLHSGSRCFSPTLFLTQAAQLPPLLSWMEPGYDLGDPWLHPVQAP